MCWFTNKDYAAEVPPPLPEIHLPAPHTKNYDESLCCLDSIVERMMRSQEETDEVVFSERHMLYIKRDEKIVLVAITFVDIKSEKGYMYQNVICLDMEDVFFTFPYIKNNEYTYLLDEYPKGIANTFAGWYTVM